MKITRIQKIRDLLTEKNSISIPELCEQFNVSKNTIRRDIAELDKEGFIRKVYGGIMLKTVNNDKPLEPFTARESRNIEAKKAIARLAVNQIKEGDVVYIDSGTTTMHMVPLLSKIAHITILTASVHVINTATEYPGLNVIAVGGSLYAPTKSFVGPNVIDCLQKYNISKVFLSCTGLALEHGATNGSQLENEIKHFLASQTCPKYLLADHSKFDAVSLMTYCPLEQLDYIITDIMPAAKYCNYCNQHNVRLLITN